jgi:mono/diheme cytochrome c family protein
MALLLLLAACQEREGGIAFGFERMIQQKKYLPFRESSFFADQRTMQRPPAGTVSRTRIIDNPLLTTGMLDSVPAAAIPVRVTPEFVALGRRRFEVYCGACHGMLGDGQSAVSRQMQLKPPPSFHTDSMRAFPPGRFFRIIAEGYGLMPSYADKIPVVERWAVVAYVQALQLSQYAPTRPLPAPARGPATAPPPPPASTQGTTPGLEVPPVGSTGELPTTGEQVPGTRPGTPSTAPPVFLPTTPAPSAPRPVPPASPPARGRRQ